MTLTTMRDLALAGAKDPIVRETAIGLVQRYARAFDPVSQLGALFRFVRDQVTFIGDVSGVETLQSPRYTLRVQAGDCDDRAILLAALARSIGIPAELTFRAIAANKRAPNQFSHVYVVANVAGKSIPLDPTFAGKPMGYEYPRPSRVEDFRL